MRSLALVFGLLLLFAAEILRIYFIMPFPGSQHKDTIDLAYFINRNAWLIRFVALLFIIYPAYMLFTRGKNWKKGLLSVIIALYAVIFFYFNFRFQADKMFLQSAWLHYLAAPLNKVDSNNLVIGVSINGQSKAYPIQFIGYHHQVRDTVGDVPVMVTYCTVCRTGRVYSPEVNGKPETFRLVGMDHFNAMFEDSSTGSWWQQATGKAVAGPLKGTALPEIPSRQSTLGAWLRDHPASLVMQPDSAFDKKYLELKTYDKGLADNGLEKRDSNSWKAKSWIVGVRAHKKEKAYDWNALERDRIINDSIGEVPVVLTLEPDSTTFHAWTRQLQDRILFFREEGGRLVDTNTRSVWNMHGKCIEGTLADSQLEPLPAYQEFWHSWQQFHPGTGKFE
jgi:hypothetical protein